MTSTSSSDIFPRAGANGGGATFSYTPSQATSMVFTIIFLISTVLHVVQGVRFRTWFMFPSVILAGVMEISGWGARFGMSHSTSSKPYIIQTVVLILAPTPLLAANFVIVGRIFARLGDGYSRLRPTWYTKVFLTGDIISLFIQSAGGAMAAKAITNGTPDASGSNIVLGGVIFQLCVLIFFIILTSEFAWRFDRKNPIRPTNTGVLTRRMRFLIIALCVNTLMLLIRGVFRAVEFIDGYSGSIANTEWMFNVFEGMMIAIAMVSLNAAHPGPVLREPIDFKSESGVLLNSMP